MHEPDSAYDFVFSDTRHITQINSHVLYTIIRISVFTMMTSVVSTNYNDLYSSTSQSNAPLVVLVLEISLVVGVPSSTICCYVYCFSTIKIRTNNYIAANAINS